MKSVNLLPSWYLRQARQARNLRIHLGFMVLLGAAMVAATFAARQHIDAIHRERGRLEAKLSQVGDPENVLKVKQAELHRLDDLRLAYRELGKTIPMSSVIQQWSCPCGFGWGSVALL